MPLWVDEILHRFSILHRVKAPHPRNSIGQPNTKRANVQIVQKIALHRTLQKFSLIQLQDFAHLQDVYLVTSGALLGGVVTVAAR